MIHLDDYPIPRLCRESIACCLYSCYILALLLLFSRYLCAANIEVFSRFRICLSDTRYIESQRTCDVAKMMPDETMSRNNA